MFHFDFSRSACVSLKSEHTIIFTHQTIKGLRLSFQSNKFLYKIKVLLEDTMTDDSYFNISEIKLSITSLLSVQIMSHLEVSDIIYSDVIDSFISKILKYKSWILAPWRKRSWTVRFTPY